MCGLCCAFHASPGVEVECRDAWRGTPPTRIGDDRLAQIGLLATDARTREQAQVALPTSDLRLLVSELQSWRLAARVNAQRPGAGKDADATE